MLAFLELHKSCSLILLGAKKDFLDFGHFLRFTDGANVNARFAADSNAWVHNQKAVVLA
jgi:hypothetical protein